MNDVQRGAPNHSRVDPAIVREDLCSTSTARRIAAMLDLEPDDLATGQALPRGWQFVLMAADTPRSALRSDGFPGLGVPMPDLGLPRLMLGERTVAFCRDIAIGAPMLRTSAVQSVVRKTSGSGPMAVVTLAHDLRSPGASEPALLETQTYLLLPPRAATAVEPPAAARDPVVATHVKTVLPDETLLFQYSALGFNSHRIHIDRHHARVVEGFPDLVVNGGLATLLLTEFLRRDLKVSPASLKVRHLAPLFCNRPVTLAADRSGARWELKAYDDRNCPAVAMEVNV